MYVGGEKHDVICYIDYYLKWNSVGFHLSNEMRNMLYNINLGNIY